LVSTTGRHYWPGLLATFSKHVDDDNADDDDDDADYDDYDDDEDDDGDGDGDGNDGPTVHSSMRVHECARPQ